MKNRCTALSDPPVGPSLTLSLFGRLFAHRDRCEKPATHWSWVGLRCAAHAEDLRAALRNPNTVVNMMIRRARTEEEIAQYVKELPMTSLTEDELCWLSVVAPNLFAVLNGEPLHTRARTQAESEYRALVEETRQSAREELAAIMRRAVHPPPNPSRPVWAIPEEERRR